MGTFTFLKSFSLIPKHHRAGTKMFSIKMKNLASLLVLFLAMADVASACQCNGVSEFDFKEGHDISECLSIYPLNSPNGRPWCYINQFNSGCGDAKPSIKRPGSFYSFIEGLSRNVSNLILFFFF